MDHLEGIAFVHVYPAYVKAHLTFDEGSFPDKKKITDESRDLWHFPYRI